MNQPRRHASAASAPVLYAVACGSPPAGHLHRLVALAQQAGWQVCVVATPDGGKFIDAPALAKQTGFPVRSHYKQPGEGDLLPDADAMVVAPATVNTVNKWACGIADTLALGMLVEGYGLGLPIVVMPYTNAAMAAHPAFQESLRRLRAWGVKVLYGEEVLAMPAPGTGAWHAGKFPWRLVLAALGPPQRRPSNPRVSGNGSNQASLNNGQSNLNYVARNRRMPADSRARLGPPAVPRPAPALLRPQGVGDVLR